VPKPQPAGDGEPFVFDGKTIDFGKLELHAKDQIVRLTLMEAQLLRYLIDMKAKSSRVRRCSKMFGFA